MLRSGLCKNSKYSSDKKKTACEYILYVRGCAPAGEISVFPAKTYCRIDLDLDSVTLSRSPQVRLIAALLLRSRAMRSVAAAAAASGSRIGLLDVKRSVYSYVYIENRKYESRNSELTHGRTASHAPPFSSLSRLGGTFPATIYTTTYIDWFQPPDVLSYTPICNARYTLPRGKSLNERNENRVAAARESQVSSAARADSQFALS